jgi:hypothetical protein
MPSLEALDTVCRFPPSFVADDAVRHFEHLPSFYVEAL